MRTGALSVGSQGQVSLRVTLESGEALCIDGAAVKDVRSLAGRTWVDCGLVVYCVRESALQIKLALQGLSSAHIAQPTTSERAFHA